MFHTPWVNCSLVFSRYDPRKSVLALIHSLITRGQNARHEKLQNLGENEVGIPKSIQSSSWKACVWAKKLRDALGCYMAWSPN